MKVVIKKKFTNSYGRTFLPSNEVLEFFEDTELFKLLKDGKVQMYGIEPEKRVIEKPGIKKIKRKTKDKKED